MRKLLVLQVLLLLALCVPAYPWGGSMMVIGGGTPAAGGGSPSYLYQENFEGTGYDSALGNMTESGSVVNEDYATSPAPLEGSQSLLMDSASGFASATSPAFSDTSPAYGFLIWSPVTLPTSGTSAPFEILNGSTVVAAIQINFSTTPKWRMLVGSTASSVGPTIVAGTTYYVWWDYTAGTGANATANLYISETTTKPSVTCAASGGNATLAANKVRFVSSSGVSDHIFDKIRVDDSDIGSDPQ